LKVLTKKEEKNEMTIITEEELDQAEKDIRYYFHWRPAFSSSDASSSASPASQSDLLKTVDIVVVDETSIVKQEENEAIEDKNVSNEDTTGVSVDGVELGQLHKWFAKCDSSVYAKVYHYFPGLRVVRLDPFECLISFICSSNNNVSRITLMVRNLCQHFGASVGTLDFSPNDEVVKSDESEADDTTKHENTDFSFYSFPTLEQLSRATEKDLRELGFGYRAKYIVKTVQMLREKESDYLLNLRKRRNLNELDSFDVVDLLTEFQGVGVKVASCTALYSMDCNDLVPTDVHILRLVRLHYCSILAVKAKEEPSNKSLLKLLNSSPSKTINASRMKEYMKMFVSIFGGNAGWAQMILYGCQTQSFKKQLPKELQQQLFSETKEKKRSRKEVKSEEEDNVESDEEITQEISEIDTPSSKRAKRKSYAESDDEECTIVRRRRKRARNTNSE